ncbi:TetR/AcrR family transcriptional regulator [Spirillospora sp. CA-294931]|uniref:TetR/AcrR family transcriptional regulator n=1 Tax=Spirillospora sp. CA-294931 TaxID=3240042 RepID=UPI003D920F6D
MARLTRAEHQEHNRAQILEAARAEFGERGFREAKIDAIAERAGLTRGAVYSNFPGKRALYFAVLADGAERRTAPPDAEPALSVPEAFGALARVWVGRLPLAVEDGDGAARLARDLMPEIVADERTRVPFAQLMRLEAILLALAMETLAASARRRVREAEAVLTTLQGVSQMAAAAPGFVEPFDVVAVCDRLAGLDLGGGWPPPHLIYASPARPADEPWLPPRARDAVLARPARLAADGVVAVLGLHRLEAAEEAVRAAAPSDTVTVALVSGDPGELGPLARLAVAELSGCLREAFPASALSRLQVVHDEGGDLARAAGVPAVGDATEAAVRVEAGRIVARAEGRGACHAAASAANTP